MADSGADTAFEDVYEAQFDKRMREFQPWLPQTDQERHQQHAIKRVLGRKAGARFGAGSYVAPGAQVFTQSLVLGDRSWIAAGAIVRGTVNFGSDCSVNPYAHIAGKVTIGSGVRIASLSSIYGFNHGFANIDVPIWRQRTTSVGVEIGDGVWIGANVVILDGCRIGANCLVAAGAVVARNFDDYQVIAGNPAKALRDRRDATPV